MKTNYTVEQLEVMNSTELRKAASDLGLKNVKTFIKADLLKMCLEQLKESEESIQVEQFVDEMSALGAPDLSADVHQPAQEDLVESKTITKSAQILEMYKAGARKMEISKALSAHYSFVNAVIKKATK
jgi:hypothetical protein